MKKVITYNVNGIRAALSKDLMGWIKTVSPDVLCFQETKAQPNQIPIFDFEEAGYHHHWFSAQKKGYSGVGIISKQAPDKIVKGMGIKKYDDEGRVIRADFGSVSVINAYHPSGSSGEERQDFKMLWLNDFYNYIQELRKERPHLIVSGDYNICHKEIDIHDPIRNANSSGFLPEERAWMTKFIDSGFTDTFRHFNDNPHQYSWWSYRANARAKNLGWRIDYNMTTKNLENCLDHALILSEAKHSDHCPVQLNINF